jgi:glucans biosynthesis protein
MPFAFSLSPSRPVHGASPRGWRWGGWLVGLLVWALSGAAFGFDLDNVAAIARQRAGQPFQPASFKLPADLKALSYDQYRDIRFHTDRALWHDQRLPFEVNFFHLGKYQTQPVQINEVDAQGQVRHVPFDPRDFDYGHNRLDTKAWGDLGYAGFRVHYPINTPAYKDEFVVFLGASYFRTVGAGQRYGLSARGLAIDTVGGSGEEFPRFTDFWLVKPAPGATSLVVYALLDSARASGAYQFTLTPGQQTLTDVRVRLYLRAPVATLGLAPLTSMYLFGENQPHREDFRPEVHDSDGLMIETSDGKGGGEWLWRPLLNPKQVFTTSFQVQSLRGFGLMQRDRSFASYEDIEARYELRPSAWITPVGDWGPGRVELVQLSTPDETNDNIVAYWVPAHAPAPGEPLDFAYRMQWQGAQQTHPPGAWVTQTRAGRGFDALAPNEHQFVVDFTGPALTALPADVTVKAVVTADANGQITESNVYRNDADGTWRMTVRVKQLRATQPVELRAFLQHGNDVLSETWTNILLPQ